MEQRQVTSNPAAYAFDVSDRLRKVLAVNDVSIEHAAEMFGVSRQSIGNWTSGRVRPGRAILMAWSMAFAVPLPWLETGVWPAEESDAWRDGLIEESRPRESNPRPFHYMSHGWTPELLELEHQMLLIAEGVEL